MDAAAADNVAGRAADTERRWHRIRTAHANALRVTRRSLFEQALQLLDRQVVLGLRVQLRNHFIQKDSRPFG